MKVIRTPDEHYFDGGYVKFSTSRKDSELHFEIVIWNKDRTNYNIMDSGKVKDEAHLKELQCMEKEIEN